MLYHQSVWVYLNPRIWQKDRSNFVPGHTSEDCLCVLFTSTGWFHSKMPLKWGVGEAALLSFTPKCTSAVTCGWACSMHIPWVPSAESPVQCSNWNICLIKSLLISERGECNQMGPFWHATSILLRWHDIKGKTISIPVVQKVRTKKLSLFSSLLQSHGTVSLQILHQQ